LRDIRVHGSPFDNCCCPWSACAVINFALLAATARFLCQKEKSENREGNGRASFEGSCAVLGGTAIAVNAGLVANKKERTMKNRIPNGPFDNPRIDDGVYAAECQRAGKTSQ
jgi:hypothetical protein